MTLQSCCHSFEADNEVPKHHKVEGEEAESNRYLNVVEGAGRKVCEAAHDFTKKGYLLASFFDALRGIGVLKVWFD